MKRKTLVAAREKKGWNQQLLADHLYPQVSKTTVSNWECALKTPRPHYKGELCRVLGFDDPEVLLKIDYSDEEANEGQKTLAETSLQENQGLVSPLPPEEANTGEALSPSASAVLEPVTSCLWQPSTSALQFIVTNPSCYFWQIAHTDYANANEMTKAIQAAIKDMHMTTGNDITRREALCELASIPMIAMGRNTTLKATRYEEMLRFCTVALEGCWELRRSNDTQGMRHAFQCVSTYVPLLDTIAHDSPKLRNQALDLAARYAMLKTMLSWTLASPIEAVNCARHALTLSDETGNILLRLSARTKLNWTYMRNKNYAMSWKTMQEGEHVLKSYLHEKKRAPLLPGIIGNFNSSYALAQVYNGINPDTALGITLDNEPLPGYIAFVQFTEANQHYEAAKIYCLKGDPVQAMSQLGKLVNTETLALLPSVNLTEETRLHVVNHLTNALLQLPEKDMGQIIKAWTAGMKGAQGRHNEVIYDEAMANLAIMKALWRSEEAIRKLMPLTSHW